MVRIWEVKFATESMGVKTFDVHQVKGNNAKEAIKNAMKIGWYGLNRNYWLHQLVHVNLIAEA